MILVVFIDFSDVRGNNLTGTIPDSIGNCTSFEILYVSYCTLHWILYLHFSLLINFLIVGNFRDISYNQITGEIPYNIGFLQVATLWAFPRQFIFLIKHRALHMKLLQLSYIFCNWHLMFCRSLQGNKLTGKIPGVIGLMQALAVL